MYATFVVGLLLVSQVESLCSGRADVIIAIDNSGSMNSNYKNVVSVLHETVLGLEIGPNAIQVGVISYPHIGMCFDLDQYTTKAALLTALERKTVKSCVTSVSSGKIIEQMYTTYFTAKRGGRANAKKIGIVVTNGQTSLSEAKHYADIARQKGISLYAIGASSWQHGREEISAIGDTPEHVFSLSVSTMDKIVVSLRSSICRDAATRFYCTKAIGGILNKYVPNSGCSTFQQLVVGHKAVTQACPAGLLFSTTSCRCEYPASVICGV